MKFGILCAMDEELDTLKRALKNEVVKSILGIPFYEGQLHNAQVILVQSGIGKVQAGLITGLLITQFGVDVVINSGSAGGIGPGLKVGDLVVSTETAYHDVDVTAFGYAPGQLPNQPERFEASSSWVTKMMAAANQVGLTVKPGLIVSGDQFIANQTTVQQILGRFPDALSSEMEGAAVGQVAHQFKTPYVVVRAMSDVGDETANLSFDEFIVEAGKRSATMLLTLFKNV